jgi:hypothetical protein
MYSQSLPLPTLQMAKANTLLTIQSLQKKTTKVLDVSWHMPNSSRNPTQEYLAGPRIPGALRWDLDKIANPKTDDAATSPDGEPDDWKTSGLAQNELGLGHMLPGPKRFATACCKSAYSVWFSGSFSHDLVRNSKTWHHAI